MQDIVYKLVPGLQEGKSHVLSLFTIQPTGDPTYNLTALQLSLRRSYQNWLGIF